MQLKHLIFSCYVLFLSGMVFGDSEFAVKRGQYSFMGFLYYADETVEDKTGLRFLRGATLIRPDWLVSSALDAYPPAFPKKTMLARMGAVTIDSSFTFNTDEDEQEREIIMIVYPADHKPAQWWVTDINLVKTLLPFKMTSAVSNIQLQPKIDISEKACSILVYSRISDNSTEDKILTQINVELLPASIENCGDDYIEKTMTCGNTKDEEKIVVFPQFCQGNKGSPLLCDNEVVGLQTYRDTSCKDPQLYQLLTAWDSFMSCGIEERCLQDHCSPFCNVINKDEPLRMWSAETVKEIYQNYSATPEPNNVTDVNNSTTWPSLVREITANASTNDTKKESSNLTRELSDATKESSNLTRESSDATLNESLNTTEKLPEATRQLPEQNGTLSNQTTELTKSFSESTELAATTKPGSRSDLSEATRHVSGDEVPTSIATNKLNSSKKFERQESTPATLENLTNYTKPLQRDDNIMKISTDISKKEGPEKVYRTRNEKIRLRAVASNFLPFKILILSLVPLPTMLCLF